MSLQSLCSRLKRLVHDCIDKHMYSAAVFYADKLAAFCGNSPESVLLLAQTFFLSKQYRRALQLLRRDGLLTLDLRFKYLAACCLLECKQLEECLALLGEDALQEEIHVAPEQVFGSTVSLHAALCMLRGKVYEAQGNRPRARASYQAALQRDAYCYEAYSALIDGHMLSCDDEADLVKGLTLDVQDKWLGLLLKAKGKKYNMEAELEGVLSDLETPLTLDLTVTTTTTASTPQQQQQQQPTDDSPAEHVGNGRVVMGRASSGPVPGVDGLGRGVPGYTLDSQNTPPEGVNMQAGGAGRQATAAQPARPLHPSRLQQVAATPGNAAVTPTVIVAGGALMQGTVSPGGDDDSKNPGEGMTMGGTLDGGKTLGQAAATPVNGSGGKDVSRQQHSSWSTYLRHITPARALSTPLMQQDTPLNGQPQHTPINSVMQLLTPPPQSLQGILTPGPGTDDSMNVVDMDAETPQLTTTLDMQSPTTLPQAAAATFMQSSQQPTVPLQPVVTGRVQGGLKRGVSVLSGGAYPQQSSHTPQATQGDSQTPLPYVSQYVTGAGPWPPGGCGLQGNVDVLTCRVDWLYHRGLYEQAYQLSSIILRADAFALQVLPLHIACCCVLGRHPELFQLGHRLTEQYPDKALSWFAVGSYYMCTRQHDMARRYLARATTLDGGVFAPAWVAYAHAFSALDERDQAMAAYRTAYRLFPGLHLPLLGMGMEYAAMNNMQLAERMLLAAHELCPWDPATCHELGCVALRNGLHPVACVWLRNALQLAAQHAKGGRREGDGTSRSSSACLPSDKDLVSALSARWEPTVVALGHSLRKQGALEEAMQWYQAALGLLPGQAGTLSSLGLCHQLQGNPREAVEAYHAALALRPDDQFTVSMLNTALVELSALDVEKW